MKRYYSPTPIWARKLGDALLAASSSITMYAIAEDNEVLAYITLITGVLGKFLTNLFSDLEIVTESVAYNSVSEPTKAPTTTTPLTTQPSTGSGGDRPPVPPINP